MPVFDPYLSNSFYFQLDTQNSYRKYPLISDTVEAFECVVREKNCHSYSNDEIRRKKTPCIASNSCHVITYSYFYFIGCCTNSTCFPWLDHKLNETEQQTLSIKVTYIDLLYYSCLIFVQIQKGQYNMDMEKS